MEQNEKQEMDGCACIGIVLDIIILILFISFPATTEPWITIRFVGIFIVAPALLLLLAIRNRRKAQAQS